MKSDNEITQDIVVAQGLQNTEADPEPVKIMTQYGYVFVGIKPDDILAIKPKIITSKKQVHKMKKIISVVGAVVIAATLSSCSTYSDQEPTLKTRSTTVFEQKLPDGKKVFCIAINEIKRGGLSCDWENAK